MIATAVEAAVLALSLPRDHPDFIAAKVDMDQKIAALDPEELKKFSAELNARRGFHSIEID